jgi:hypothetical protein
VNRIGGRGECRQQQRECRDVNLHTGIVSNIRRVVGRGSAARKAGRMCYLNPSHTSKGVRLACQ